MSRLDRANAEIARLRAELDARTRVGDELADVLQNLPRSPLGWRSQAEHAAQAWRAARGDATTDPAWDRLPPVDSDAFRRRDYSGTAPAAAPPDGQAPADERTLLTDVVQRLRQLSTICGRDEDVDDLAHRVVKHRDRAAPTDGQGRGDERSQFDECARCGHQYQNHVGLDSSRCNAGEPCSCSGFAAPADDTAAPDPRTARQVRDDLAAENGDNGPIIAEDEGPVGPRWWTPTRVYGANTAKRTVVSSPRNPPGGDTDAPVRIPRDPNQVTADIVQAVWDEEGPDGVADWIRDMAAAAGDTAAPARSSREYLGEAAAFFHARTGALDDLAVGDAGPKTQRYAGVLAREALTAVAAARPARGTDGGAST